MFLTTLCRNKGRVCALQTCALLFMLFSLLSCTAAIQNGQQPKSSQLLAENSMMKKRLPLMERESDVLQKENLQHRKKIQELEMENTQLDLELASLREKYESDITAGKEQISSLEETIQKIEQENRVSIDTLIADNKVLEEKMVRDRRALNDQIVMLKAAFKQEREKLMQENGQRELSLADKLSVANRKLVAKDLEISSLETSLGEMSGKLDKAHALSAELTKAKDATGAELESMNAAGIKAGKENQARLESLQAANAELNKKITELANELSRQKQTTPPSVQKP